ncbi:MAG: fused MFS/spermidine synthase [Sphingopyxis sp.]|nr:fused MFS/spermidine synthase [Sphingopyxis sp.]
MTTETAFTEQASSNRWLFTLTIFVGSFLLFMVQPMVARMALPQLGGAPAVWNSAMLVYQALLLGGYAYAHWLGRFAVRRQAMVHLLLLAAAALWLPVGLANLAPPAAGQEALWVPLLLAASIGPVFFAVAAQAPLMQRWFAADGNAADPYALYAASNLGSFSGLLSYPLLVEPLMPLATQSWGWALGYGVLALLVVLVARARWTAASAEHAAPTSPRLATGRMVHWLLLAAVPSGLMLSTTTHLTTDIFAMPLLWVIPLGLYLLSFVFAFGNWPRTAETMRVIAPAFLLLAGGLSLLSHNNGSLLVAASSLVMLFVVSTALHNRLYEMRPATDRLTLFYLIMSAGGALGGLFAALIAPLLFDWVYEHPILVIAAALLLPLPALLPWAERFKVHPTTARMMVAGLVAAAAAATMPFADATEMSGAHFAAIGFAALVGLMVIPWRWAFATSIALIMFTVGGATTIAKSLEGNRTRSYFGVYTVRDDAALQRRMLAHGTTLHGLMLTSKGRELTPTTYYTPQSGVGLALTKAPALFGANASVGIVGLGTGTLACYRQAGQAWDIYEIDQTMVDIARDSGDFAFVLRCAPDARILVGDARIELAKQSAARYDVLAIDAFSSDAIPLHLLTSEAFGVYDRALKPGGILLVHISNRFFDLEPVLADEARRRGWASAVRLDTPTKKAAGDGATASVWVAFSNDPARLAALTGALVDRDSAEAPGVWAATQAQSGFSGWTDDYASILPVVQWKNLFPGLE